jgi:hypothetical protein
VLHLDVGNVQGVDFNALDLGVGLSVLEQVQQVAARLLGPATRRGLVLLDLGLVADAAGVPRKEEVRCAWSGDNATWLS